MFILNIWMQKELSHDIAQVEVVNHYPNSSSTFYVRNPSLVGEGVLDSSLFQPLLGTAAKR